MAGNVQVNISSLGDRAILMEFGSEIHYSHFSYITSLIHTLESKPFPGFIECSPSYTTVTVVYEPYAFLHSPSPFQEIKKILLEKMNQVTIDQQTQARNIVIPVCYGGERGPDLSAVASFHGISEEEVIRIHSSAYYQVYMLGFSPGFPYIGGLPREISTPRKSTPRLKIPSGSVGIGGEQTGIYPLETPGGWNIIGQTPLTLFQPEKMPPTLLQRGDQVTFVPITQEEFAKIQREEKFKWDL
jgi:inhibitor of KinA